MLRQIETSILTRLAPVQELLRSNDSDISLMTQEDAGNIAVSIKRGNIREVQVKVDVLLPSRVQSSTECFPVVEKVWGLLHTFQPDSAAGVLANMSWELTTEGKRWLLIVYYTAAISPYVFEFPDSDDTLSGREVVSRSAQYSLVPPQSEMFSAQTKQIVKAFQLLEETDPEWLQAIVNRPTGSQWGQTLNDWTDIANLPWQPLLITDRIDGLHLPQCVYYHYVKKHDIEQKWGLTELHPDATENIKLLSEFDDFSSIRIEMGAHGLELMSDEVQPRKTEEAWLIIGPQRGKDYPPGIVWTAYPGRIASTVIRHPLWDGTLDCLSAIARTKIPVAVKGIASP